MVRQMNSSPNINYPTIPEFIVVHLGAPNEDAKNITIPFAEYIKNVGSSEIYPTWPLDAIKANLLAQISFALNRVYNEWYKSRGYDFDITNSPIYDQAFIEDREIFDTISKVTDEIFNDYITKGNQIQPLFAQYCDGKNTTCNGLSQWGTVTEANKGKNPKEILQYYYGNDINLVYDAPISANLESYIGFPLGLGSAGNQIRTLKAELNRIGSNYPAIPKITDDSVFFNIETENAVKKFQEIFNLPITGIVDKATWYKIKYIYSSVKRLSELYSEGITIEEAELKYPDKLQKGDTGEEIRVIHYYLKVIAFFYPEVPDLEVNGIFDENTETMVKAFQKKYGLEETGVVEQVTYGKLQEAYKNIIENIPPEYVSHINEFYPGYFLTKGITNNDDVRRLQLLLYKICIKTKSIPGVRVTGNFDDLTEKSVMKIQDMRNLEINGAVGPVTWYEIIQLSNE